MKTLKEWQDAAHQLSRSKGWYDGADEVTPERIAVKLALIHSEVSEALEAVRVDHMTTTERVLQGELHSVGLISLKGKPEGYPSELADIVIRVMDLCGWTGVDLDAEIARKHAYNETRPHRHGGKAI